MSSMMQGNVSENILIQFNNIVKKQQATVHFRRDGILWYSYKMVTQNILRIDEGKQVKKILFVTVI